MTTKTSGYIGAFALALLGGISAVAAESPLGSQVKSLVEEVNLSNAKATALVQEMNGISSQNKELKREYDIYRDQIENRIRPAAIRLNAEIGTFKADSQRHEAAVQRHNSGCPATTTSEAVHARCNGEAQQLNQWRGSLQARKSSFQNRAVAIKRDEARYLPRLNQLAEQSKRNEAQWRQKHEEWEQLTQHLKTAAAKLVEACNTAEQQHDLEALHHCHSVNWDGANPDLPPLTDKQNRSPPLMAR